MSRYLDASAIVKLYLDEPGSDLASQLLEADPDWVSGRHTYVEVRRNLARALPGRSATHARALFVRQWAYVDVIELDARVCERAAELAERTGARTLDALHLGAADSAAGGELPFVTFDRRLAEAADSLGWTVLPG